MVLQLYQYRADEAYQQFEQLPWLMKGDLDEPFHRF